MLIELRQALISYQDCHMLLLILAGSFEVEGELETLQLPTTLNDSIRLRLATVRERDADLDRLLRLAACMSGKFTKDCMVRVWRSLTAEQTLDGAIERGPSQPSSLVRFLPVCSSLPPASGLWVLECGVLSCRGA